MTPRGEPTFRQTRWRAGYDPTEVNAFVQTVEDALQSPTPQLDAFDVYWREFTTVRLRPGYHMDDVDSYLERAEQALGHRERRGHGPPKPQPYRDPGVSRAT
jgi:DivIVA domain-containing protein